METSSRELPMLLSDFAARVGASVDLVSYHVRRGLIGQKHHGRTFFYEDDVQKFLTGRIGGPVRTVGKNLNISLDESYARA